MAENKEKLFDQFPPVSPETWRAKAEVDLKGADFNKKLVWRTNEGFNLQPMYRLSDIKDLKTTDSLPGEYPYIRGTRTNNDWAVRQDITVGDDPKAANAKALDILNKGVTSIGFGLKSVEPDTVQTLLEGIYVPAIEINFVCCPMKTLALTIQLVKYLEQTGDTDSFNGSIGFNPMKRLYGRGLDFGLDMAKLAAKIVKAAQKVKGLRVIAVDSYKLCNAGAYIYQELGYALSWGNEWMAELTAEGIDPAEAARRIKFNMGISTNYFMEIAKFRAARMLWAQIVKHYSPTPDDDACKMVVNAVTSEFNQTIYDAYVNLLRSQTETMSAAIAGVDSITVTPFDKQYKTPDDFSERIARNQQLLLKEESHIDKVVDPAGGSYYVEILTTSIAEQAWKLFLETEEKGGFYAAMKDGSVQAAVNASCDKRHTDVARRKESLLGTNQFPNFSEMAASKIETQQCGHGGSCKHPGDEDQVVIETLKNKRAASDFEQLRLDTERSGKRPKVFMLTIGNLAMRLARSQFSSNFFACAGYEIIDNLGFATVEEGIEAGLEKKADIIVLCSSDDEYATFGPEAYKALDGRAEFVIAGAPACADDLKSIGITNFVNVRSNVLETLQAFNEKLLK